MSQDTNKMIFPWEKRKYFPSFFLTWYTLVELTPTSDWEFKCCCMKAEYLVNKSNDEYRGTVPEIRCRIHLRLCRNTFCKCSANWNDLKRSEHFLLLLSGGNRKKKKNRNEKYPLPLSFRCCDYKDHPLNPSPHFS